MKTLIQQTGYFRSLGNKLLLGLVVASAISALSLSPAFADRDYGYGGGYRGGDRGHHEWRGEGRRQEWRGVNRCLSGRTVVVY